ncbi:toxin C-terminal domain-containing protein [Streptomyces sp. NBC_01728]|uniref:toxin C-terminal domain-containing protein n=1 Tax=unclassified Streptomyces TaxID=2593676 RepID=UPI0022578DD0|nr:MULTISPECIES: toxin C-terminal domain-containing protein [unclassified Streptomyces]MCX4452873.1 toxin C-terminal domain-containing protein [Streptomyces sp. NBC_01719]MCX4492233.1 toxin C-terminal domain-containing protein [Streptomyces sp. NBC_01728]
MHPDGACGGASSICNGNVETFTPNGHGGYDYNSQPYTGYNTSSGGGTASTTSTGTLYDSQGSTTSAGVPVPGPVPYYDPTWANDPQVMNWANTAGHGLENFLFGIGLPFTNLLDITSALYTPACAVEGQCLTDRYKAWGKGHGLSPDSNTAGIGAAIGSLGAGGGKAVPEEVPMKPGYEPAPFNPKDPYSPESVQKRQDYNKELYQPSTADRAGELGYHTAIKANRAPFHSHGQDVYFNGKNYITRDVDGHNVTDGWKMFNRQGRRIGTYDPDLNYLKP